MGTKGRLQSKATVAAIGILVGCVLYAAASIIVDNMSYSNVGAEEQEQRILHLNSTSLTSVTTTTTTPIHPTRDLLPSSPIISAIGPGPTLTGLAGQIYNFHETSVRPQGLSYFKIVASPTFHWNISPYRWNTCPESEHLYLGDTTFVFHHLGQQHHQNVNENMDPPDMFQVLANQDEEDHDKMMLANQERQDKLDLHSKYLRFRVTRRDERECLWNFSQSCLAGGSFVMNFGKTARDILYPGNYSLKTNDNVNDGGGRDVIRIVAYNTNRDCSIRHVINHRGSPVEEEDGDSANVPQPQDEMLEEKTPIDYLRQILPSTMNPTECQTWIDARQSKDDLFHFNSDLATVHIDTPWMNIVLQVHQNKVATEDTCLWANIDVWITNISAQVLEEGVSGMLGDRNQLDVDVHGSTISDVGTTTMGGRVMGRALKYDEAEEQEVEGPFA